MAGWESLRLALLGAVARLRREPRAQPGGRAAELAVHQALAGEYAALRPGSDFASQDKMALFATVHRQPQAFSALCISGGGIRSATFALGAIQGLARHGLLQRFDYLSTVSGGGYIGGWLSAWSNRAGGLERVIPGLRPDAKPAEPGAADPIAHLREYNNYMSPKLGALSADTWTLAATILRNLLLNWMVLIPLLMAALIAPRLYLSLLNFPEVVAKFASAMQWRADAQACGTCCGELLNYCDSKLDAISGSPAVNYGLPLLMALLFATAVFNTLRYLPGVGNQDHTRADFAAKVLLPLAGAVLAYLGFDSLYYLGSRFTREGRLWVQIFGALVPCALAWLAYLVVSKRRSRTRTGFAPLSLAVFVMAGGTGVAIWVAANFILFELSWPAYVTLGPPAILLGYVLGTVAFVGLSSRFLKDEDREWMSRSMASMLMFCALWTLVCGLVLVAPTWLLHSEAWIASAVAAAGAVSGWASAFGGALMARKAPAGAPGKAWSAAAVAIQAAPAVFIAALAIGLSIATNLLLNAVQLLPGAGAIAAMQVLATGGAAIAWTEHSAVLTHTHPMLLATLLAALLAVAWIMARYININSFSLHGMYRDRLIRAYLGASNARRHANKFTGFARGDDFAMHALDPRLRPMHVVNLTLNLVATSRLAWQQRKAQPFTVTPLHCGNFELGYRPSALYGGPHGISLGTAVAISGAAASPNMGSFSSPMAGFIMTLLNARLGAWLGNPGPAGARTWQHAGPRSALDSLAREAFGLTSNDNPYVYLSDGGHFENLGLYEMVLRRCRCIVVLDAECDPDHAFNNLGNALRKVRIDLGITISFDDALMRGLRERSKRCAVASIGYSAVDEGGQDGWLVYIKLMRTGNEPLDVDNYFRGHPDFPHQSTGDQWFDEAQTESYRMLGLHGVDEICAGWQGGSLDDWRGHVEQHCLAGQGAGS
ncbi:MAG: patatin-like phospholipase family protein [Burkholderiaceae bacterium]